MTKNTVLGGNCCIFQPLFPPYELFKAIFAINDTLYCNFCHILSQTFLTPINSSQTDFAEMTPCCQCHMKVSPASPRRCRGRRSSCRRRSCSRASRRPSPGCPPPGRGRGWRRRARRGSRGTYKCWQSGRLAVWTWNTDIRFLIKLSLDISLPTCSRRVESYPHWRRCLGISAAIFLHIAEIPAQFHNCQWHIFNSYLYLCNFN